MSQFASKGIMSWCFTKQQIQMPAVRDPIEWCSGIFDIKVSFLAGAKMKTSIFWVGAVSKKHRLYCLQRLLRLLHTNMNQHKSHSTHMENHHIVFSQTEDPSGYTSFIRNSDSPKANHFHASINSCKYSWGWDLSPQIYDDPMQSAVMSIYLAI